MAAMHTSSANARMSLVVHPEQIVMEGPSVPYFGTFELSESAKPLASSRNPDKGNRILGRWEEG